MAEQKHPREDAEFTDARPDERHSGALGAWLLRQAWRTGPRFEAEVRGFVLRRAQQGAERLDSRMRRDLLKADLDLDALLAFSGPPE